MKISAKFRDYIREQLDERVQKRVDEVFVMLNEISAGTLGSYIKKARTSLANHSYDAGSADAEHGHVPDDSPESHGLAKAGNRADKKVKHRAAGIARAADSLVKKSLREETEQMLNELSPETLKSYREKATDQAFKSKNAEKVVKRVKGATRAAGKIEIDSWMKKEAVASGILDKRIVENHYTPANVGDMVGKVVPKAVAYGPHPNKIKAIYHAKDDEGLVVQAKMHDGKVYKINPRAVNFKLPRVGDHIELGQHTVVEGMIDYPDNAEAALSPKEVAALLNTFKRNSNIHPDGDEGDYSRSTISPMDDDEEDKKIHEEAEAEALAEMCTELFEGLMEVSSGLTEDVELTFEDNSSVTINESLAQRILEAGILEQIVVAENVEQFNNILDEGLRHIKTYEGNNRTAKVYKDAEWQEHRVKFFRDGVHQKEADHHTDDAQEAHDTAKGFIERGR